MYGLFRKHALSLMKEKNVKKLAFINNEGD